MRKWVWAIWTTTAGISAGLPAGVCRADAAGDSLELSWASPRHVAAPPEQETTEQFNFDLTPIAARSREEPIANPDIPDFFIKPLRLAQVDEPENVYPEIMPPQTHENLNGGGVNFGLDIDWFSDYVYRGVDQNTPGFRPENSLQFTAQAQFDLGTLPHPFIGLFVNVFNSDPISRFEEVRPFFGAEWTLKPISVDAGYISYIYPNRKNIDTQEVFTKITLDDSRLLRTSAPIFSPYIYGAYDVDLYKGFYLEAGLRHDFVFEDFGFTFSPVGDVAYVANNPHYAQTLGGRNWGLQHYDVGAIANFSLNHLFKADHHHGEWSVNGYLNYTGRFDNLLRADNLIWGGVGLEFRY